MLVVLLANCTPSSNDVLYTLEPSVQVFLAEYALNELDAQKVAVVGGRFTSGYGDGWFDGGIEPFETSFTALGGDVLTITSENDLNTIAENIINSDAQIVLIGELDGPAVLPTFNNPGLYGILMEKGFDGNVFAIEQGHTFKKTVCMASSTPIIHGLMIIIPAEAFAGKYEPETVQGTGFVVLAYDENCDLKKV